MTTYKAHLISELINVFKEKYSKRYDVIFSPGRINIIGEHTDYNNGFVMPGAIDKGIYIVYAKNNLNKIRAYSFDFDSEIIADMDAIEPVSFSWANYILGVIKEIQNLDPKISGFDMVFGGDIPIGSGLSSSAALECGVGTVLNELYELNLEKIKIIKAGQQAEHKFVGVRCGIMDQFASALGKKDQVIKLDCRSLDYQYFPIQLKDYQILLFNSNVKHSLADSSYNKRREECETGVEVLKEKYPQVHSLRDATIEMMSTISNDISETVYNRCTYIIEENQRVLEASEFLKNGNLKDFGKLLFDSHMGLSKKYEVSCEELDFLVAQVLENDNVLGARMMGGGFGGCTINFIKKTERKELVDAMKTKYYNKFQIELECYDVYLGNGTHTIKNEEYGAV